MASVGYVPPVQVASLPNIKIGIVYTQWNQDIIQALLGGAKKVLGNHQITQIEELQVPGAFELPMGAKFLLQKQKLDAIICLGCIIKGDTDHDRYIAEAVSQGLTLLGLQSGVPCIFGVLTTNSLDQALERAGGRLGNKGEEAAHAAIHMSAIKATIKASNTHIGF